MNRKKLHDRIEVIHEDRDLVVINKASGVLTYPLPTDRQESAIQLIRRYWRSREARNDHLYLIHRLDKETSGLLVFAKTSISRRSLQLQFERHSVVRSYLAVTNGAPAKQKGEIRTFLARNRRGKRSVSRSGTVALTAYELLFVDSSHNRALIRCRLQTGRTHQIRIHLAYLGAPVMGDTVYGAAPAKRMALHAEAIGFYHPRTNQPVVFRTSMPADLRNLMHFEPQRPQRPQK